MTETLVAISGYVAGAATIILGCLDIEAEMIRIRKREGQFELVCVDNMGVEQAVEPLDEMTVRTLVGDLNRCEYAPWPEFESRGRQMWFR